MSQREPGDFPAVTAETQAIWDQNATWSEQDLQDRVRRLEQLAAGLNAELVRMAMGSEPMLECEVRTYLEALQELATSAKVAASALQTAVARIGREEERARGAVPWERR